MIATDIFVINSTVNFTGKSSSTTTFDPNKHDVFLTLEGIPENIVVKNKEGIQKIICNYLFEMETDELKKKIKLEILSLLNNDVRKMKLDEIDQR